MKIRLLVLCSSFVFSSAALAGTIENFACSGLLQTVYQNQDETNLIYSISDYNPIGPVGNFFSLKINTNDNGSGKPGCNSEDICKTSITFNRDVTFVFPMRNGGYTDKTWISNLKTEIKKGESLVIYQYATDDNVNYDPSQDGPFDYKPQPAGICSFLSYDNDNQEQVGQVGQVGKLPASNLKVTSIEQTNTGKNIAQLEEDNGIVMDHG